MHMNSSSSIQHARLVRSALSVPRLEIDALFIFLFRLHGSSKLMPSLIEALCSSKAVERGCFVIQALK